MARIPKPTALKVLHGDRKSRVNAGEPVPPTGLGEPPAWLDDEGREAWRRVAAVLEPMRIADMPPPECP